MVGKNQSKHNHRTYILIPARNESKSVRIVIRELIGQHPSARCVVIDDHSNDGTGKRANKAGAAVIRLPYNQGSGGAIHYGLQHLGRFKDVASIVLMDADGQHDPSYISALVDEVKQGADYVIGSRYLRKTDYVTSFVRRLGTAVIRFLLHMRYGVTITDPTSGFRAMNRRTFRLLAKEYPVRFSEPETIMLLLERGYKVREAGVTMRPRMYGKSSISTLNAFRLMWYIIRRLVFRFDPVDNGKRAISVNTDRVKVPR